MLKKLIKNTIFFMFGNFIFIFLRLLLRKDCIYVVNYHATYPRYENNFKKQLNFYKNYFDIIDENFLIGKKQPFKGSKPKILITFDDGHITNYTSAAKILDSLEIKASFFIPVNVINRETEKNISTENQVLSDDHNILSDLKEDIINSYSRLSMAWSDIIDLDKRGHFIGSHGCNHVRLSKELNNDQLRSEILESKKIIEERLNKKINSFCWIIGDRKSYTKNASDIIFNSDYKRSFMTCAKPFDRSQSLLQIHRFNIEDHFSLSRIYFILSGFYELMYFKKRNFLNNVTK